MSRFFTTGNPIFGALDSIIDVAYVSILWLIFSIPVVTIGASTTAMYYTVTKVIRHNRGYIFREFWRGFKSNFKQSTIIWLLYLLIMTIFCIDIRIMWYFDNNITYMLQYTFIIAMIAVTVILFYALAYTARFVQNVKHILINSALMSLRHLPKTILLIAVTVLAGFSVYFVGFAFFLAPAVAAVVDSIILESIFVHYMSEEDRRKEEMRNHPEQYEYLINRDE